MTRPHKDDIIQSYSISAAGEVRLVFRVPKCHLHVCRWHFFCFPGQFHTGKCSVPKGALFLYIQGNQPQQNRKGAIKNAETMPRQLFHPVHPVPGHAGSPWGEPQGQPVGTHWGQPSAGGRAGYEVPSLWGQIRLRPLRQPGCHCRHSGKPGLGYPGGRPVLPPAGYRLQEPVGSSQDQRHRSAQARKGEAGRSAQFLPGAAQGQRAAADPGREGVGSPFWGQPGLLHPGDWPAAGRAAEENGRAILGQWVWDRLFWPRHHQRVLEVAWTERRPAQHLWKDAGGGG